jgi:2-phospho-L-lactate guanylyltransferase
MGVFAIVPVKGLNVSKRRLSASLSLNERKALTSALLKDVLTALQSSRKIQKIVVVSDDNEVRAISKEAGAFFFSPIRGGLNAAVNEAARWCKKNHATSTLIIPADLPLLRVQDINTIIKLGTYQNPTVVLSPSSNGGTNALFQNPPSLISGAFGHGSFAKHAKKARKKGVAVKFYCSESVALDIDTGSDLQKLLQNVRGGYSQRFLEESGYADKLKAQG